MNHKSLALAVLVPSVVFFGAVADAFGPPISCITDQVGCYMLNSDRAVQLRSDSVLEGRSAEGTRVTIQEPGVVELKDNRLMMFC